MLAPFRDLMTQLSSGAPHVVPPIGFVVEPPTCPSPHRAVLHSPHAPKPLWPLRLLFARDVCAAVAHCHQHDVVIRDVKPANFLVTAAFTAHLADLELARTEDQIRSPRRLAYGGPSSRRKTRFEGTPEYMAPELLRAPGSQLQRGVVQATKAVDVYAVGVSLNEVATGQVPYTGVETTTEQLNTVVETRFTPSALLTAIAHDGLRPTPPADPACPAEWAPLAARCWDHDAAARPSAAAALSAVEAMVAAAAVPLGAGLRGAERHDWPSALRHIAGAPPDGRPGRPPPIVRGAGEGTAGRRELMEDAWCGA
eukprot:gene47485-5525_t